MRSLRQSEFSVYPLECAAAFCGTSSKSFRGGYLHVVRTRNFVMRASSRSLALLQLRLFPPRLDPTAINPKIISTSYRYLYAFLLRRETPRRSMLKILVLSTPRRYNRLSQIAKPQRFRALVFLLRRL